VPNTDSKSVDRIRDRGFFAAWLNHYLKGWVAGANPEVGRDSALEDQEKITQLLTGCGTWFLSRLVWVVEQVRVLHLFIAKVARGIRYFDGRCCY